MKQGTRTMRTLGRFSSRSALFVFPSTSLLFLLFLHFDIVITVYSYIYCILEKLWQNCQIMICIKICRVYRYTQPDFIYHITIIIKTQALVCVKNRQKYPIYTLRPDTCSPVINYVILYIYQSNKSTRAGDFSTLFDNTI